MLTMGSIWGIDLGDSALKAVKLVRHKKRLVIEDCVVTRYADITTDSNVPDEERRQMALRSLVSRVGKDPVVAGIPSENVLSRFISLPPVEKRHLRDIVVYEARQQIPFDLNEVVWDYQRVKKEYVQGEEVDIGLFAAKREHIDQYLSTMSSLSKNLSGLKLSPLAVYEFIRKDMGQDKPLIILDIGAKTTDLIILEGEKFWLRNLRKAGNNFTQAIQRKFNISFEEAENVKIHMAQSKHRAKIFEVLTPVAQDLVTEIQRSVGYYKSISREALIEDIVVVGDGYRIHGLDRFMSERLQYNVHTIEETREFEFAPNVEEEARKHLPAITGAIGLALQGMGDCAITVQFLPEDYLVRRELSKKKISAVAASILLMLSIGGLWLASSRAASAMSSYEQIGSQVLRTARDYESRFNQVRNQVQSERRQMDSLVGLDARRDVWSIRLKALADSLPENIFIDNLRVASSPGTGVDDPEGRRFDGPMDMDYDPMGGMDPGQSQQSGNDERWFTFSARADAALGVSRFRDDLYNQLAEASAYPERIKIFEEVQIGPIRLEETDVQEPDRASRTREIRRPSDVRPSTAATQRLLRADVACKLVTEENLRQLRRQAAEE